MDKKIYDENRRLREAAHHGKLYASVPVPEGDAIRPVFTREQATALVEYGETSFGPADLVNAHDEAVSVLREALGEPPEAAPVPVEEPEAPERFQYNADLRLVLENWGVAIPSPEAEAAFDRVIEHNRRYGCYAT